jgi:hypothetical protein
MDFERQGANHSDAEPARGCLSRAGLKPERGSVEKLPRKSKGAVSKRVIPLTGDRGFESLYLHRKSLLHTRFCRRLPSPAQEAPQMRGVKGKGFLGPVRFGARFGVIS